MSWLTPLTGLILAAALIPPLILLYFLKLRRKPSPIASTLLWHRSVEDLRANAPFQRLRRNLLLFLQLIVLILLALSVMQPRLHAGQQSGGRSIVLIDNSASMTATDSEDGTRLDEAKRRARERIESMYAGGLFSRSAGETMVVAFSDRADVRSRFTSSKQRLLAAIDGIEPTHATTSIEEALKLARAYTTNPDPDLDRPVGAPAALDLYSDGHIADLGDQVLRGESMAFHPVGTIEADNVAMASLTVERPYNRPTSVEVFAAVLNFNQTPVTCDMQMSVNGVVLSIQEIEVAAARPDPTSTQPKMIPGRNNVVFTPFDQPRGAVIEVANLRPDDLAADNVAQVVVPPPKRLTVALVTEGSSLVKAVLEGLALEEIVILSGARYERRAETGELEEYDVVVFDGYVPMALPPGRYLSFGAAPPVEGLNEFGDAKPQVVLAWKNEHPALQYVSLDNVFISRSRLLQPADDVEILSEGSAGPVIVAVSRGPMQLIHVTFDPLDTNWPYQRSFVTFVFNAIELLGHSGEALTSQGFAPGDALTARLPASANAINLQRPGDPNEPELIPPPLDLLPSDPTQLSWGPIRLAGLHMLEWSEAGQDERMTKAVAVNLLSESEGDITLRPTIQIGRDTVSGEMTDDSVYTPLWPYAVGLCLAVLMLEWWIYHRKAFV